MYRFLFTGMQHLPRVLASNLVMSNPQPPGILWLSQTLPLPRRNYLPIPNYNVTVRLSLQTNGSLTTPPTYSNPWSVIGIPKLPNYVTDCYNTPRLGSLAAARAYLHALIHMMLQRAHNSSSVNCTVLSRKARTVHRLSGH